MSDEGEALASAAQSLRETAKWLVGGVAATAAGVFTGGSLTALGSLSPTADGLRLGEAGAGFVAGMSALALIFGAAIRVLTRESLTLRALSASTDTEDVTVRGQMEARYRGMLTEGDHTLRAYIAGVDVALQAPQVEANAALLRRSVKDSVTIAADAAFHLVRARFDTLVSRLKWATLLAIAGFGLFAWAANPPKPDAPAPSVSLTIR